MDYVKLLKKIREKELLSQTELAEKLGVSFVSVNRWENGRHQPSYKAKRKIVSVCKEDGIDLLGDKENGTH